MKTTILLSRLEKLIEFGHKSGIFTGALGGKWKAGQRWSISTAGGSGNRIPLNKAPARISLYGDAKDAHPTAIISKRGRDEHGIQKTEWDLLDTVDASKINTHENAMKVRSVGDAISSHLKKNNSNIHAYALPLMEQRMPKIGFGESGQKILANKYGKLGKRSGFIPGVEGRNVHLYHPEYVKRILAIEKAEGSSSPRLGKSDISALMRLTRNQA